MPRILFPLPSTAFDPTETGVPWRILKNAGIEIAFATPDGKAGQCDPRMFDGCGLGVLAPLLAADRNGRAAYLEMKNSADFQNPITWASIDTTQFDGILLPGGHDKGMRPYLESEILQNAVAEFITQKKPVGAICHGVVLAARSRKNGKSVLFGKKTTALLARQELMAWRLTCLWLKDYYRTYPQTVETEVKESLATTDDFLQGPMPVLRDSPTHLNRGFVVKDGNYLSARWPGDAHRFGQEYLNCLRK